MGPREWASAPEQINREYGVYAERRPKGGDPLDVYRADADGAEQSLVVFHHIRKTAGSSVRNVMFTNRGSRSLEVTSAEPTSEWYERFWAREGHTGVVWLAGHSAHFVVPSVARPVTLLAMLRDPVDRVVSRYYFGRTKNWPLEQAFGFGPETGKTAFFVNGQARSILAPYHDVVTMPREADEPEADLWRERLFAIAERYIFGLQDRFEESLSLFARELGWTELYTATSKVNRSRPTTDSIPAATRATIERFNWLDRELYAWASERLAAART